MRSAIVLSALAALAAAAPSPAPQLIDFTQVDAAPDTGVEVAPVDVVSQAVSAIPSSSATAVVAAAVSETPLSSRDIKIAFKKRDICTTQPAGTGPAVNDPDTTAAFLAYQPFIDAANDAELPIGYEQAFVNEQGSTQQSGYMGLKTLSSYDTIGCSQYCSSTTGCKAFNIYYERDPSVDPNDASCADPSSVTNIKCVLWGNPICAETATNTGQWRNEFQIVIAGSNGYNSDAVAPTVTGYTAPTELGGAVNAPLYYGVDTYMGYKYFSFGDDEGQYPYEEPRLCTDACTAQTAYNTAHPASDGTYQVCEQVIAYVLSKNNVPQGQYCAMYTHQWDASYATNYGQYRGSDYYSVGEAWMYNVAQ